MSLINDALKQAKRENPGQTGDAESSEFSGAPRPGNVHATTSSGGGYRVVKLIAVVLIAAALIAIFALNAYHLFGGGNNEQSNAAAVDSDSDKQKETNEAKTPIEYTENTVEKVADRGRKESGHQTNNSSSSQTPAREAQKSDDEKEGDPSKAPDDLRSKLSITGIVSSGDNSMAIINGKVVKVGENINGVMLQRIEADNVFIRHNNKVFTIPKP